MPKFAHNTEVAFSLEGEEGGGFFVLADQDQPDIAVNVIDGEIPGLGTVVSVTLEWEDLVKTPQQILNEAADLLDKPDVCLYKNDGVIDSDGSEVSSAGDVECYCALTSIMTVARFADYGEAKTLFAAHVGIHADHITFWNDVPERRKADVVAALRAAAR